MFFFTFFHAVCQTKGISFENSISANHAFDKLIKCEVQTGTQNSCQERTDNKSLYFTLANVNINIHFY